MCITVKNRFIFRKIVQGRREKTIDWYHRLYKQAKLCNFANIYEPIFDQIVEKTEIFELRRHAFREKLSLSELLKLAEKYESSDEKCFRCGAKDHRFYDTSVCLSINKNILHKCECMLDLSESCVDMPRKRRALESICDNQVKVIKIEPKDDKHVMMKNIQKEIEIVPVKIEKNFRQNSSAQEFYNRHCAPIKQEIKVEKNLIRDPRLKPRLKFSQPPSLPSTLPLQKIKQEHPEKFFKCTIGGITSRIHVSDYFAVNVITKRFFDNRRIQCIFHSNKFISLNSRNYTCMLETKIIRGNFHVPVEFFFSEEIDDDKCYVTSNIARKLGVYY